MITYNENFEPFKGKFIEVKIPQEKIDRITLLVRDLVKAKSVESHHIIDSKQEYKRFTTGFIGEAAIEELTKLKIIDWTIGNSNKYNVPDIRIANVKIGIKTVEYGKFPVIFKENYYPQIINVLVSNNTVLVCGIATQDVLNRFQSDELILSPLLRGRGTKTGFYGFSELIPVEEFIRKNRLF